MHAYTHTWRILNFNHYSLVMIITVTEIGNLHKIRADNVPYFIELCILFHYQIYTCM